MPDVNPPEPAQTKPPWWEVLHCPRTVDLEAARIHLRLEKGKLDWNVRSAWDQAERLNRAYQEAVTEIRARGRAEVSP